MKTSLLTISTCVILLLISKPARSQDFDVYDARVFMAADDFFQNKYLEADKTSNVKYFRKDKVNVAEKKEAWGFLNYPQGTSGFRPLYRSYFKGDMDYVLVQALGTICLYATGAYFADESGKASIGHNRTEPYLFSVGLDGPIMSVNRKNLEAAMSNDPQALQRIESTINNVSSNAEQYMGSREQVVRFYNERHPSGKIEFDLLAPDKPHKKKN